MFLQLRNLQVAQGILTLQGNGASDQFNFNSNISAGTTSNFWKCWSQDTFQFDNANITSNVTLHTGDDADKLSFVTKTQETILKYQISQLQVITLNLILLLLMEVMGMF